MSESESWLTPEEIAAELRLSVETIRRHLRAGHIHGTQVGRQWRIRRSEYQRVLREGIILEENGRYTFPTVLLATRFTRNARSRGYIARRQGAIVTVRGDQLDAQLTELLAHYGGMMP